MSPEPGNHLVYSANVLLVKSVSLAEQVSLSNEKHPVCFAGGRGTERSVFCLDALTDMGMVHFRRVSPSAAQAIA